MHSPLASSPWTFGQKIWFRFLFVFFGLIIFPFPLNVIPGISSITSYYDEGWTWLINVVGKAFFDVAEPLTGQSTGSGDKLYDWIWHVCILGLAFVAGSIWTLVDRGRTDYAKLRNWFILFVTYYLAYFLLVYGIIKLYYLQFRPPNLERLFQEVGHISPMRLLWTFMGFSKGYTIFSGFCETLAGALLLFRRTRTLGALTAVGVMLNVFMLNMSYDVPVKLFSLQLMIMGLYLASLDWKRLLAFFILNEPIDPKAEEPLVQNKRGQYVVIGMQMLLIGYTVLTQVMGGIEGSNAYGEGREKSPLYGVYEVETFVHQGDTLAPLLTDTTRWRRILFDYPGRSSIGLMDAGYLRYQTEIDTLEQTITFTGSDTTNQHIFTYQQTDSTLFMDGIWRNDTISILFQTYPIEKFGLLNRGFHWVNEVPYNRYKDGW